jgi:hypothetical protein
MGYTEDALLAEMKAVGASLERGDTRTNERIDRHCRGNG